MDEPRTPSRAKMREWPMFLAAEKRSHGRRSAETEGRPLPRIADLILEPAEEYSIAPSGPDVYRCFVIPTNLARDAYLSAIDFRPSSPRGPGS